jgi:hypothetical protein
LPEKRQHQLLPEALDMSSNGTLWIADNNYGLVRFPGKMLNPYFPEGPPITGFFTLCQWNGDLWITPGGRTDSWSNLWQLPRFQHYTEMEWSTFSQKNIPEMDGFFDIVEIVAHPSNPNHHVFVASWGGGLLEFLNGELVNRYTNKNSPLQSALPQQPDAPYVRIGGMDFDSEGNLWITNSEVEKNLLKLTPPENGNPFP